MTWREASKVNFRFGSCPCLHSPGTSGSEMDLKAQTKTFLQSSTNTADRPIGGNKIEATEREKNTGLKETQKFGNN